MLKKISIKIKLITLGVITVLSLMALLGLSRYSASYVAEMSHGTELLELINKEMLILRRNEAVASRSLPEADSYQPEEPPQLEMSQPEAKALNKPKVITLDDSDFGKY